MTEVPSEMGGMKSHFIIGEIYIGRYTRCLSWASSRNVE